MWKNYADWLLTLLATVVAFTLGLIYCLRPPQEKSKRLYLLFIHCIPNAIVALVAIPVVYWIISPARFVELPLGSSMQVAHTTETVQATHDGETMQAIPEEIEKAARGENDGTERDILLIVDAQIDFISGALKAYNVPRVLKSINSAIRLAESKGMLVIFTKDWHPENHWSFKENGGPWPKHCVRGTPGAELWPNLYRPTGSLTVEFGVEPGTLGYSPLENDALGALLASPEVGTVYVAGIALEYCVQATCRGALQKGKKVIALENVIASAEGNKEEEEKVWRDLQEIDVIRERRTAAWAE